MSSSTKPLPERYRMAYNVEPGFEVQMDDGGWVRVAHQMHIVFPANIVTFTLSDGSEKTVPGRSKVMSRRPHLEVRS